jgi:hypothetical protein
VPFKITLRSTSHKENEKKGRKGKVTKPKKGNPVKARMDELRKKYNNFGF